MDDPFIVWCRAAGVNVIYHPLALLPVLQWMSKVQLHPPQAWYLYGPWLRLVSMARTVD